MPMCTQPNLHRAECLPIPSSPGTVTARVLSERRELGRLVRDTTAFYSKEPLLSAHNS